VQRVVAVEPNRSLRTDAEAAAARAPVFVEVHEGVADRLPLDDGAADAAVVSLVLCSVPDQPEALAELRRVVRPGGELRFYEHVRPTGQPKRALAGVLDRSGLWPRVAGGCHLSRDTEAAIEAAGFAIARIERFPFSPSALEPSLPYILGVAVRA
jgi:ubiquinone/menaquinone biosynthesis C-methylase UbiE